MASNCNEIKFLNRQQPLETDENCMLFRENKESITLIWFDKSIESNLEDIQVTINILREINDYVLFFTAFDHCVQYIKSIKSEMIFLIVSGNDAHCLLSEIHHLRQVNSVFIFCMDELKHRKTLIENGNYFKIIDVFTDQNSLAQSIRHNIQLAEKQMAIFNVYNQKQRSTRNLTKESGSFIWHRLLKDVLQKMPSGDQKAKEEMLDKCRLYYRDNKKELGNIDQFEQDYSIDKAIKWYTQDSFLFKLTNKALRTEDVELLYTFRFYLIDLCSQLIDNHKMVLKYYETLQLCRGAKQTQDEIQRLKDSIGHLILINGYFSTSENRKVAEIYAGIGVVNKSDLESIIYEINYDTNLHSSTIVANVTNHSCFREEEEFLFDLGAIFEIDDVFYNEDKKYWLCKMSPSDKGLNIAEEYIDFQKNEMDNDKLDSLILFGNVLYDMGEYVKCCSYFENLLSLQSEKDYSTVINIYRGLGRALIGVGESELSQKYLQYAHDLCVKNGSSSSSKLARILCFIGVTYDSQGKFDTALEYYFQGLQTAEKAFTSKRLISYILSKIGAAYYSKGQDDFALESFEKSYKYVENLVPEYHPDISEYYTNMCMVYYHKGYYDQALHYQTKSYENDKRILPMDNHMHLSVDLNNIGKCLYKKCQYIQAMQYFKEGLDIARKILKNADNYSDMGITINNIGKCCYRQKNYAAALKQYDIVLKLIKKANLNDHIDMAYTLKNIGEVYLALFNHNLAFKYFTQALDIYKKVFNNLEHRDVAKCLNLIGQCYYYKNNHNDDSTCQNYYNEALHIWQNVLPDSHPDLALCFKNMSLFYLNRRLDYVQAGKYYTISYRIYEKTVTNDHPHLIEMYNIKRMISKCRQSAILSMMIETIKLILFLFLFSLIFCF